MTKSGGLERERIRKLAINRLLDQHDQDMGDLNKRVTEESIEDQNVARESLRSKTTDLLINFLYQPEYSARDAMRASVRELMQLADDVLVTNEEADLLGRSIELEAPSAVLAEWDGEDFGNLITKLGKIRRSYLLGCSLVGPLLAQRIAEHVTDNLFGPKLVTPKPSVNRAPNTNVSLNVPAEKIRVNTNPRKRRDDDG